ncbi:hypothetical protein WOLCODRAFT_154989 [Wolfiporia cocos MD-104 SS10]|uniref:Uncharacterized protein n=1 Tax=Wolfiporia cocos (strain MD-104) TaxID=742152 RepID=A0A2H3K1B8_WOLCO|nr:hypothetical protein WOLCODRAFT_154989 [Wolfiporia cocos MD-104 SS10]
MTGVHRVCGCAPQGVGVRKVVFGVVHAIVARSRLVDVLFTTHSRSGSRPPVCRSLNVLNPGLVHTVNDAASLLPVIFSAVVHTLWALPSRGAHTSVFAAAAPAVRAQPETDQGAYLQPPGEIGMQTHGILRDIEIMIEC